MKCAEEAHSSADENDYDYDYSEVIRMLRASTASESELIALEQKHQAAEAKASAMESQLAALE